MTTLQRAAAAAALLCLVLATRPGRAASPVAETRFLLGTVVTVTLWDPPLGTARGAFEAAFDAFDAVDREMARRPGTALGRLNEAGRGTVSAPLGEVIGAALAWARRTGGAFDPTVAPLLDLWDIASGPHPPPDGEALARARSRVGWQRIRWEPSSRRLDLGGTALDLGGIAKAYALDRAVTALRRAGVRNFLVDAGGDVFAAGSKGGPPWRVGIRHPREGDGFLRVVEPQEGALLTSGDYQRAFSWQGTTYHHLLDPGTGLPSRRCQSVTLWVPQATLVPSAAVFLLGPEEGLKLLTTVPGAEGLAVDAEGRVHETPGFARVAPARRTAP